MTNLYMKKERKKTKMKLKTIAKTTCVVNENKKKKRNEKKLTNIVNKK